MDKITPYSNIVQNTQLGINTSDNSSSLFSNEMNLATMNINPSGLNNLTAGDIGQLILAMLGTGSTDSILPVFMSLLASNSLKGTQNTYNDILAQNGTTPVSSEVTGTPVRAGLPTSPSVVSTIINRSPQLYRMVIDQFQVEINPRYEVNKNGSGNTYCNIFVWDVTSAMGAEIPHYVDPKTLAPMQYPNISGCRELSGNGTADWLAKVGADYGWNEVTPEMAQKMANLGRPVVTAFYNPGHSGHVQMVCPSEDGTYNPEKGVTISQAGSSLYNYAYITQVYGKSLSQVKYYAHF